MKAIDSSFDGLLTDYALSEIEDPEVAALIEALLERDDSYRATIDEIRTAAALITDAGAESLVVTPRSTSMRWPVAIPAAAAGIAAVILIFLNFPANHEKEEPGPIAANPNAITGVAATSNDRESKKLWSVRRDLPNRSNSSRRGGNVRWVSFSEPPEWKL